MVESLGYGILVVSKSLAKYEVRLSENNLCTLHGGEKGNTKYMRRGNNEAKSGNRRNKYSTNKHMHKNNSILFYFLFELFG